MSESESVDESESPELRELLRSALADKEGSPDVLRGVQQKLRERSGGKFYRDAWSTERQPPAQTYLITSLLMLAILFVAYALLHPLSGKARHVPMTPEPVHILPPTSPH